MLRRRRYTRRVCGVRRRALDCDCAIRKWLPDDVAEAGVDAVRLLRRLLRELDAAAPQLLERLLRVVVVKKSPPPAPFAISSWICRRVSSSKTGGPGIAMSVIDDVLPRDADGEPAEVAHLRHGRRPRATPCRASRCRTASASSWSCTQTWTCVSCFSMCSSGSSDRSRPTLARAPPRVFSKTAGARARVRLQHAGRDARARGRRMRGAVRRRGEPVRAAEARRERADAAEPDGRSRCPRPSGRCCGAAPRRARAAASAGTGAASRRTTRRNSRLKCAGER